jgi:hypothetical protein
VNAGESRNSEPQRRVASRGEITARPLGWRPLSGLLGGKSVAVSLQANTARRYDLSKQELTRGRRHRDDSRREQRLASLPPGIASAPARAAAPAGFCLPANGGCHGA